MSIPIVPDCESCALRERCPNRVAGGFCTSWCTDAANDPRTLAAQPKPYEEDFDW